MDNDKAPDGSPIQEEITISASEPAHNWAFKAMSGSDHGFHGFEGCPTCLNRYAVLVTAFDAGFQYGIDSAKEFSGSGLVVPGSVEGRRGSPLL